MQIDFMELWREAQGIWLSRATSEGVDQDEAAARVLEQAFAAAVEEERRKAVEEATDERKFKLGDRVTKTKGSSWTGHIVGFYSTSLTKIGYAVESENEPGSVQIYPEDSLELASLLEW